MIKFLETWFSQMLSLYIRTEQLVESTLDCVHSVFASLFLNLLFQDLKHTNKGKVIQDPGHGGLVAILIPYEKQRNLTDLSNTPCFFATDHLKRAKLAYI